MLLALGLLWFAPSGNPAGTRLATYFFSPACPKCARVEPLLRALEARGWKVELVDCSWVEGIEKLEGFDDRYRIPEHKRQETPALFLGDRAFIGAEEIAAGIRELASLGPTAPEGDKGSGITEAEERHTETVRLPSTTLETPPSAQVRERRQRAQGGRGDQAARQRLLGRFQGWGLLTIVAAAAVDSINPCAIATLIFMLSYLAIGRRRGAQYRDSSPTLPSLALRTRRSEDGPHIGAPTLAKRRWRGADAVSQPNPLPREGASSRPLNPLPRGEGGGVGDRRGEIIWIGLAFTSGIFLANFGVGLGLLRGVRALTASYEAGRYVYAVAALLTLCLAALSLRDWWLVKQGRAQQMALQLPQSVKRLTHALIRRMGSGERGIEKTGTGHAPLPPRSGGQSSFPRNSPYIPGAIILAAFVTALAVSLLEFVCTGQVYLPTLTYVAALPELRVKAVTYLALYNLVFVAPLVALLGATYLGVSSRRLAEAFSARLGAAKLLLALIFLALSGWMGYLAVAI